MSLEFRQFLYMPRNILNEGEKMKLWNEGVRMQRSVCIFRTGMKPNRTTL